jgi:predicted Zn-ribbon and HTH transcriptional regulator
MQKTLFIIREYDEWFSNSSQVIMGVFDSKTKAIKEIKNHYKSQNMVLSPNGEDQWWIERAGVAVCNDCGHEENIESFDSICPHCGSKDTSLVADELIGGVMITEVIPNKIEEI